MPCFLVGENVAQAVSLACGADLEKTSHQVGHILAALYSCGKLDMLSSDKPLRLFTSAVALQIFFCASLTRLS